jgi:hypothetical protein
LRVRMRAARGDAQALSALRRHLHGLRRGMFRPAGFYANAGVTWD